jgi:hypothetical protein
MSLPMMAVVRRVLLFVVLRVSCLVWSGLLIIVPALRRDRRVAGAFGVVGKVGFNQA